ncbi:hypothetical protein AGMMS50212_03730 [Spirochaetia bacterium]|nr:hypothetical protein AGMMS50212_03730 [Spirochaetia bacterium]
MKPCKFLIWIVGTVLLFVSCLTKPITLDENALNEKPEEIQVIQNDEEVLDVQDLETGNAEIVKLTEESILPVVLEYNFVIDEPVERIAAPVLSEENTENDKPPEIVDIIETEPLSDDPKIDDDSIEDQVEAALEVQQGENIEAQEIAQEAEPEENIEAAPEPEKPPPPPDFIRPSQPVTEKEVEPPAAIKPLPVLTARNPPTETNTEKKPNFSRTIKAVPGQFVEIPFADIGWIYLGEQNNVRGLVYDSKLTDDNKMNFIFRAEKAGNYSLKFYKQDFLKDITLNDYVQVIVENNNNPQTVTADTNNSVDGAAQEIARNAERAADENPENLRNNARAAFEAGNFEQTIAALDKLAALYPEITDEALWLYGQSFEANTKARDIRSALDCYTRLTREYPQSKYYKDADNRAAYIKRFYFNIR